MTDATRARGRSVPRPIRHRVTRWVRIRRRRRMLLMGMGLFLVLETAAALLTSPRLQLKRVVLQGTAGLQPSEVAQVEQAAAPLRCSNLFLAPVGRVQQSILALPCMAHAEVQRALPGVARILLTPRIPVARLLQKNSAWELDAHANFIRPCAADNSALTMVQWVSGEEAYSGNPAVRSALGLLQDLPVGLQSRIRKIIIDQNSNICLNMYDGLVVKMGQEEQLQKKAALLARIYDKAPNVARQLALVDLSCPSMPACILRKTVTAAVAKTAAVLHPVD